MASGRKAGGESAVFSPSFGGAALLAVTSLWLVSCNCNPPLRISPVQREDKKMDCNAIILEMNEAEFYRTLAESAAKKSMMKVYAPVCMVWGQADSWGAYSNAADRLEYLSRIYNLLECAGKLQGAGAGDAAKGDKKPAASAVPLPPAPVPSAPVLRQAPPVPGAVYGSAPPAGYYSAPPAAGYNPAPAPRPPAGYYSAPPAAGYNPVPTSPGGVPAPGPAASRPVAPSGPPVGNGSYPSAGGCCYPSCYYCPPYAGAPAR